MALGEVPCREARGMLEREKTREQAGKDTQGRVLQGHTLADRRETEPLTAEYGKIQEQTGQKGQLRGSLGPPSAPALGGGGQHWLCTNSTRGNEARP